MVPERLTVIAPFCGPGLAKEVADEKAGAAVEVAGVEVAVVLAPPPHPHNKAPDKTIAAIIAAPARMRILCIFIGKRIERLLPRTL